MACCGDDADFAEEAGPLHEKQFTRAEERDRLEGAADEERMWRKFHGRRVKEHFGGNAGRGKHWSGGESDDASDSIAGTEAKSDSAAERVAGKESPRGDDLSAADEGGEERFAAGFRAARGERTRRGAVAREIGNNHAQTESQKAARVVIHHFFCSGEAVEQENASECGLFVRLEEVYGEGAALREKHLLVLRRRRTENEERSGGQK